MAKSVIKEIIIVLLMCLAIILVLGILLYEYVPTSKTLPNKVSYTTPENVKQELLSSSDVDDTQVIVTYEVDQDDLSNYKKVKDYVPGKADPFSSYETTDSDSTDNSSSTGGSSSNSSSTSNSNTSTNTTTDDNSSSGGHFFQNTGTK